MGQPAPEWRLVARVVFWWWGSQGRGAEGQSAAQSAMTPATDPAGSVALFRRWAALHEPYQSHSSGGKGRGGRSLQFPAKYSAVDDRACLKTCLKPKNPQKSEPRVFCHAGQQHKIQASGRVTRSRFEAEMICRAPIGWRAASRERIGRQKRSACACCTPCSPCKSLQMLACVFCPGNGSGLRMRVRGSAPHTEAGAARP